MKYTSTLTVFHITSWKQRSSTFLVLCDDVLATHTVSLCTSVFLT